MRGIRDELALRGQHGLEPLRHVVEGGGDRLLFLRACRFRPSREIAALDPPRRVREAAQRS
jgi:hypothetical protein